MQLLYQDLWAEMKEKGVLEVVVSITLEKIETSQTEVSTL